MREQARFHTPEQYAALEAKLQDVTNRYAQMVNNAGAHNNDLFNRMVDAIGWMARMAQSGDPAALALCKQWLEVLQLASAAAHGIQVPKGNVDPPLPLPPRGAVQPDTLEKIRHGKSGRTEA